MEQANRNTVASKHPQLDYAPVPLWDRRRRQVGRWVLFVVIVATALALVKVYAPVSRRLQVIYWQGQCMKYSPPPDQVIYEQPKSISVVPSACQKFMGALGQGWSTCGTAYVHERRRPDGEKRLVFVELIETWSYPGPSNKANPADVALLSTRVFRPGTLFGPAVEVPLGWRIVSSRSPYLDTASTRVFAGQSDLSNPSHFTIRYAASSTEAIIDGYLRNDDTVTLEVRRPETAGAVK